MTFEEALNKVFIKYGISPSKFESSINLGFYSHYYINENYEEAAELYAQSLDAKAWEEGVTVGLMAHSTRMSGGITNFKNPYKNENTQP